MFFKTSARINRARLCTKAYKGEQKQVRVMQPRMHPTTVQTCHWLTVIVHGSVFTCLPPPPWRFKPVFHVNWLPAASLTAMLSSCRTHCVTVPTRLYFTSVETAASLSLTAGDLAARHAKSYLAQTIIPTPGNRGNTEHSAAEMTVPLHYEMACG